MLLSNVTPSLVFGLLSVIGGGSVVHNVNSLRTDIEKTNQAIRSKILELDIKQGNEMLSNISDVAKKGSGALTGIERMNNPLLKNLNEEFGKNMSYLMNENPLILLAIVSGVGYYAYAAYQNNQKETVKQNS